MSKGNDTPMEAPVAVSLIAGRFGLTDEAVWARVTEQDIVLDWDDTPSVTRSRAAELYRMLRAEKDANDRLNRERIDAQMDEEAAARRWPVTVYEALAKQDRGPAVQVSLPGEGKTPDWAEGDTGTVVQP